MLKAETILGIKKTIEGLRRNPCVEFKKVDVIKKENLSIQSEFNKNDVNIIRKGANVRSIMTDVKNIFDLMKVKISHDEKELLKIKKEERVSIIFRAKKVNPLNESSLFGTFQVLVDFHIVFNILKYKNDPDSFSTIVFCKNMSSFNILDHEVEQLSCEKRNFPAVYLPVYDKLSEGLKAITDITKIVDRCENSNFIELSSSDFVKKNICIKNEYIASMHNMDEQSIYRDAIKRIYRDAIKRIYRDAITLIDDANISRKGANVRSRNLLFGEESLSEEEFVDLVRNEQDAEMCIKKDDIATKKGYTKRETGITRKGTGVSYMRMFIAILIFLSLSYVFFI